MESPASPRTSSPTERILLYCLNLDAVAEKVYSRFAQKAETPELQAFWRKMAREEAGHGAFWRKMLAAASRGELPRLFDRPEEVEEELARTACEVQNLLAEYELDPRTNTAFVMGYRMEFHLLHPALEVFFQYAEQTGNMSPERDYSRHLSEFMEAFSLHAEGSSGLELLSLTIKRLWGENRKLAARVFTDELTGIYNRRGFLNMVRPLLHLAMREGRQVGVLMADVDDFKKVNDSLGHLEGDRVLVELAARIRERIRGSDVAGRWGGEEFIVFVNNVDPGRLEAVAEGIRSRVADTPMADIAVTLSIGAAAGLLEGNPEKALNHLVRLADE
ncbi:MAG: diguanylate cyclase, partial [Pseudomonadota bacterium]